MVDRTGSDFVNNLIHTLDIDSVTAQAGVRFYCLHESPVTTVAKEIRYGLLPVPAMKVR